MRDFLAAALGTLMLACAVPGAWAQVANNATPVYHGVLQIVPATGSIDRHTGNATLKVRRWRFLPTPESNGIFPDQEPIVVALGDDSFYLPAGTLKASRGGKVFRYRASRSTGPRAVESFRIQRRAHGAYYIIDFTLAGVELSQLRLNYPVCLPTAVIVGDDDGFGGASVTRPLGFGSPRVAIPRECDVGNQWPWIRS